MFASRGCRLAIALWAWLLIAAGTGLLVGLESWAWMRYGTSAIALAIGGAISIGVTLAIAAICLAIAYGALSGITGVDPLGWEANSSSSSSSSGACDPNYKGECLDPNASDYDCAGGSGDGPEYTGPVEVVGSDVFGLDRDGDGYACGW